MGCSGDALPFYRNSWAGWEVCVNKYHLCHEIIFDEQGAHLVRMVDSASCVQQHSLMKLLAAFVEAM